MHWGPLFFSLLSLVATATMLLTRPSNWTYGLTIAASTGFVLAAVAGYPWKHCYGGLMLLGLLLCAAGDITGMHNFDWGAVAFLGAHVVFSMAFYAEGVTGKRLLATAVPMMVVDLALLAWLLPHVPVSDRWLIVPYLCLISIMVVLAGGIRLAMWRVMPLAGALLFFISDIFVARWKYVYPSGVNAYFCYPLYYLACLCLAVTISIKTHTTTKRNVVLGAQE